MCFLKLISRQDGWSFIINEQFIDYWQSQRIWYLFLHCAK